MNEDGTAINRSLMERFLFFKEEIMEELLNIQEEALAKIAACQDLKQLNEARVFYLGKKGPIQNAMKSMKNMEGSERAQFGKVSNQVKQTITKAIEDKKVQLEEEAVLAKLNSETIDITLPSFQIEEGSMHPMMLVQEEMEDFFIGMGYEVADGPEIETDHFNFELLNVPKGHPARDMQDTFYIDENTLLRSQTSPVQAHVMLAHEGKGPIKIICPGKTYRRDDDDATHSHQFKQCEGLVIDKNITLSDLKGTLELYAKKAFGEKREIRLRPSYFPFTEPSVEVDISCHNCGGKGCAMCKGTGWIEICGAGMVNPHVLEMCGFDPDVYQGFAFGFGIERIAMLKYVIDNIRHFYNDDLSLNLLNNYVKVDDIDPEELANKVTSIGLEVEGMHVLAYGDKLVIGYIHSLEMHPDSDHLRVCQVEVAPGQINQIICGAPNVAAHQKVIVALPGCDLGNGFIIKNSKIRGVESNGMICSIAELGINNRFLRDEDRDGIHILDADAPIGEDALSYLGLKDTILEIGLTPNRADCMAMTSFAYEVGALLHREVKLPEIKPMNELPSDIEIKIETEKCPFFSAKLVKGINTKESPAWLKNYLMASGIKPINNVVDISNFVMIETGQPIHMYDYDKLTKKEFVIRQGYHEKAKLLDEQEYQLEDDDIIVSTDGGVGCVAGVYGAYSTRVEDSTKNIVIEVATFDGATLRGTARRLNLLTDASQHYIKGALNTANSLNVLDRCANLLQELADATEIYESVSSGYHYEQKVVDVTTYQVNHLLGTKITTEEIGDIFASLCFEYTLEDECFHVTIPTYRNDITMAADLIEEVARMYGFDYIPSTLPEMSMTTGLLTDYQAKEREIRHILIHAGLHEALTYTLTSPGSVDDFNLFHHGEAVKLLSPLGEERSVCRKSVIPSLLQAIQYNQSRNIKDVALFETSNTMDNDGQIKLLSIACTGTYYTSSWQQTTKEYDFYVVKGWIEKIFDQLGIESTRYKLVRIEGDQKSYHPGRTALIKIQNKVVGVIGQIHPAMEKKYDVKNVYVAELNLDELLALPTGKVAYKEIAVYPTVSRDIALVCNKEVLADQLINVIKREGKKLLKEAKIFDVYEGEHVDEGKKSIAISLVFQDVNKTLSEAEVNKALNRILAGLEKDCGAILRQ